MPKDPSPTDLTVQASPLHPLRPLPEGSHSLLDTSEAAALMGKTYRQFTAYASHHRLPRASEGDAPPLYDRALIMEHAERAAGRSGHRQPRQIIRKAEQAEQAEGISALVKYSQQVTELARTNHQLAVRNDELHERIHDIERAGQEAVRAAEAGAREREAYIKAEYEATLADVRQSVALERQRAEAEKARREKAEQTEKHLRMAGLWQRILGRF